MKSYRIKFVLDKNINVETTINSELEINDFADWFFNEKYQKSKLMGLYGEPTKIIINTDKVLYYTVEEIKK